MTTIALAALVLKVAIVIGATLFAVAAVQGALTKPETEREHDRLAESDREKARAALAFRQRGER